MPTNPTLYAISDLHLNHKANREIALALHPTHPDDWLIIAGDIGHQMDDVVDFLALMRQRFARVLFTPGNHDLWSRGDEHHRRGAERYHRLVEACRTRAVTTPEDPYPLWADANGDVVIAPVFVLYDYSLRPEGSTKAQAMARAAAAGVICNDELLLHADPYPDRESWCADRLRDTTARLNALPANARTVLISHWPLHPGPVSRLRHPEFSLWCGTRQTADWHLRYRAVCSVHGHLHIPISEEYDGVRHEEVSLGYPRERAARTRPVAYGPRPILTGA